MWMKIYSIIISTHFTFKGRKDMKTLKCHQLFRIYTAHLHVASKPTSNSLKIKSSTVFLLFERHGNDDEYMHIQEFTVKSACKQ